MIKKLKRIRKIEKIKISEGKIGRKIEKIKLRGKSIIISVVGRN